jgi:hypothetical protein
MFLMDLRCLRSGHATIAAYPNQGKAAQIVQRRGGPLLVVGMLQLPNGIYTWVGRELSPRGSFRNSRHSASLPMARESDPTARGNSEIFQTSLVAEGAGHDPASAPKDAADYKSAPLPVRGNPPLSKSRCASKASVKLVGVTRLERATY